MRSQFLLFDLKQKGKRLEKLDYTLCTTAITVCVILRLEMTQLQALSELYCFSILQIFKIKLSIRNVCKALASGPNLKLK